MVNTWLVTGHVILALGIIGQVGGQAIDGGWSPYSFVSTCTKTCNNGTKMTIRSCTEPIPQNGGLQCMKEDGATRGDFEEKIVPCATQSCFENMYTDWSNCSVICGKGTREKQPMCGDEICNGAQGRPAMSEACNTWNKTTCPSPCLEVTCPEYGVCKDISTEEEPKYECACTMGYNMNTAKTACIRPPPTIPTPRPIPTLPPEQKTVATVMSKTASTVIIIFVTLTLVLFFVLRIFTVDRVIQMNMEIALLCAHLMLLFPPTLSESSPTFCRIISILNHLFFTACFMFMTLEALHMYTLVAFVVKKDGMFNRLQNIMVGWGLSGFIILSNMCFEYESYGGKYHCWLQMDTNLMYGQYIPVISLMIISFTLIEAAGAADYKPLKGSDQKQMMSAKFSQRTNLLLIPLVFVHWMLGMFSEYEQNLGLYGVFSMVNGLLGFLVFICHCSNNQQVRQKLKDLYAKMCKGGSK